MLIPRAGARTGKGTGTPQESTRGTMITIKDVAARAGVSPGTVSNVLTGKRPVSEATRARVYQAIQELGYRPNLLARSLVNRRTETIAVVTSELEYYVPSRILSGIDRRREELGYTLLLSLIRDPATEDVEPIVRHLTARQVDGIVWAVHQVGRNRCWFRQANLDELPPMVFLGSEPFPGLITVSTDNRRGVFLAVDHLVERGRRVIGHLAGPPDWWEARERLAAWQERLRHHGLSPDAELVAAGDWSAASGAEALKELLTRRPDVDAVLVANDPMAFGAIQAARQLGRRVPEDLAVVGFDDIPEAAFACPPLTTVHQELLAIGAQALTLLHQAIVRRYEEDGGEERPIHIQIPPRLIVRESG